MKSLLEERMHEVVTRGIVGALLATHKTNAKKDIDQALDDFFNHNDEEMASLYRPVGDLGGP